MQFIIIGLDDTDDEAQARRAAARDAHLAICEDGVKKGEHLMGAAMLNDNEQMCGSVMIVDFPDRAALEDWLKTEPYVTGKVWNKIDIIPCKVGPSFTAK